jgi:hypothetical protein
VRAKGLSLDKRSHECPFVSQTLPYASVRCYRFTNVTRCRIVLEIPRSWNELF